MISDFFWRYVWGGRIQNKILDDDSIKVLKVDRIKVFEVICTISKMSKNVGNFKL